VLALPAHALEGENDRLYSPKKFPQFAQIVAYSSKAFREMSTTIGKLREISMMRMAA
jgi:hypothetical protein